MHRRPCEKMEQQRFVMLFGELLVWRRGAQALASSAPVPTLRGMSSRYTGARREALRLLLEAWHRESRDERFLARSRRQSRSVRGVRSALQLMRRDNAQ